MKRINIYLKQEQKYKLNCICYKYRVSISTIAENLLFLFTKYIIRRESDIEKEKYKEIGRKYLYEETGTKTCIKPRNIVTGELYENMTKAYTNVLHMYLNKELNKYLTDEELKQYYQDLNTKLQKTNEPNWNYNKFIRYMKRYEKEK